MDEHSIQEVETRDKIVISDSLTNQALLTSANNTPWVSTIKVATTEGRILILVVVFTKALLHGQ